MFFQLIPQGSVLISSNRTGEEWKDVYGDQVVAAAILDRPLHHRGEVAFRPEGTSQNSPTGGTTDDNQPQERRKP